MYYININGVNTRVMESLRRSYQRSKYYAISTDLECQGVVKQECLYQRRSIIIQIQRGNVNVHVEGRMHQ